MNYSRRDFLQQVGTITTGMVVLPAATLTAHPTRTVTRPGLQLYSLRDDMERDPIATLRAVAKMGYKEIESYPGSKGFLWGMKPPEFKAFMTELGLTPVAAHCGIKKDMQKLMDEAAAGGFKNIVVSWLAKEKRGTLDGFRAIADEFNHYGEMARKSGLTFGYHNHDYPFIDLDGQTPYEILLTRTDPRLVTFEMDLFWVVEPGKDPIAFLSKYPGRFSMLHVKDRDPKNAKYSTIIGQGDLPLARMMTAGQKAGVKYFFVEVEEYGSLTPIESVRQSLSGLTKIQF